MIGRKRVNRKVDSIRLDGQVIDLPPAWSFAIICKHHGEIRFDFQPLCRNEREELTKQFRDAVWSLRHELVGQTLRGVFQQITIYFWAFLDDQEGAGAEAEHGDAEAGRAEVAVFHRTAPVGMRAHCTRSHRHRSRPPAGRSVPEAPRPLQSPRGIARGSDLGRNALGGHAVKDGGIATRVAPTFSIPPRSIPAIQGPPPAIEGLQSVAMLRTWPSTSTMR